MNEFKTYHPLVNFLYFAFVIGFSMIFMNPICLFTAFFCGLLYSGILGGVKKLKSNLCYGIPVLLISALINPLFNHRGTTILAYFPSGNPFTLESAVYGLMAGFMLVSVIFWFSCFNEIVTSDKIIYLFGKIFPSLSLIFSMTLRFVPRFTAQLKKTADARKAMGQSISDGNILKKIKNGLTLLSGLLTWALENSIETADSMKARGYGLKGRTFFSIFKFEKRDFFAVIYILFSAIYIIYGKASGALDFSCFPTLPAFFGGELSVSIYKLSLYFVYFGLFVMPVVIEFTEVIRWSFLKSKI